MNYRRYGEFRFCDYTGTWLSIILCLVVAITALLFDIKVSMGIDITYVFLVYALIYAYSRLEAVVRPNRETFSFRENSIIAVHGKSTRTIAVPTRITIIMSYADICPPMGYRSIWAQRTHILANKYAISLIREIPTNQVIDKLNANHGLKYTTSMIESAFSQHYIYSFVCNQELLESVFKKYNCTLIYPESLTECFSLKPVSGQVFCVPDREWV